MLDQKCKKGQTPFFKACKWGSVKVLEVLVREGAGKIDVNAKVPGLDLNAKDRLGLNGLHLACKKGK